MIRQFVDGWKERGSEKSDAQSFWLDLLRALGIGNPTKFIAFELPIDVDEHQCYIDAWINRTRVLIEQKSRGIDLDKSARQSDGAFLTPFEQALRYAYALPFSKRPRWIVVYNFVELRVYDMDQYHRRRDESYAPNVIMIERLTHEFSRLNFLVDPDDENVNPALKISKQAGELVGLIYRSFERGFVALHDVESKKLGRRQRPAHDVRRPTEGTVPTRVGDAPSRTFLSSDLASNTGGGLDGATAGASVSPPFETTSVPHIDKNRAVGGLNAPSHSASHDRTSDAGGDLDGAPAGASVSHPFEPNSDPHTDKNGAVGGRNTPSPSASPDLTSDTGGGLGDATAGASVSPPFEPTFDPHTDKNGAVGGRNTPSPSFSPDLTSDTGSGLGVRNAPSHSASPDFVSDTRGVVSSPSFSSDLTSDTGGGLDGATAGASVSPPFETNSDPYSALNRLCVRLVFCLYAEDSGIFNRNQFTDYLRSAPDIASALRDLFAVLNTPIEDRSDDIPAPLKSFPFVGGRLFSEEEYEVPTFNRATTFYLLTRAKEFDWSGISPTIFGALFESTLNPNTRRSGGMHYTSIENIHKVIDPLFLNMFHEEFKVVRRKKKNKRRALEEFQRRLSELKFFDPACGSGNFLTETYLSLRRLENEVIRELCKLGAQCSILVSIENFFGVEINDFAVAVARTAMWIAENQMLQETEMIIHEEINFLPLTSAVHIVEGNALTLDWSEIAPRVDYIIGNPPFSGRRYQTPAQRADIANFFRYKDVDYVACWFKRAADFMLDTDTRAALVATNSITQGEQVPAVWKDILNTAHIDFAWRPFRWTGESDDMASVHCVIIGFSVAPNDRPRIIFDGDEKIVASNINGYLLDAPNYFIESRSTPLCDVPSMRNGNMFADGRHLIINDDELDEFLRREPRAKKFIRPLLGAEEFLKGKKRWCLWLVNATEDEIKSMPLVADRVEAVRQFRLKSTFKKLAATPHLFRDRNAPDKFTVVPVVSSERRRYVPMGFMTKETIVTTQVQIIPDADLFHFGVLESSVHMAWMRAICGRLEVDYRYSKSIVYNNFPWCSRSARIEETAQGILDARALYPDRSLASLYDPNLMPSDLRAAHRDNDRAVLEAYGFDHSMSEAELVGRLMERYRSLAS